MNAIKFADAALTKIHLGETPVARAYLGSDVVYSAPAPVTATPTPTPAPTPNP